MSGGSESLLILGTAARANAQILHLNGVKEEIALGLRPMRPAYGIKLRHESPAKGRKFRASECGNKARRWCNVRFWHIADVPLALTNVCFEGKNGHDAGVTPFPLMTQSGHRRARQTSYGRRGSTADRLHAQTNKPEECRSNFPRGPAVVQCIAG